MKKRIIVIGGSYFIGRVFSIMADKSGDFELTVINRGRFPLKRPGIREYVYNRNDGALASLFAAEKPFDALVDFCAYEPGDIKKTFSLLKDKFLHYIEISSCGVFAPSREKRNEESPLVARQPENPIEDYAFKKMLLEKELKENAETCGIPYTILRPCFVYGPFNYAPRESWYFNLMAKNMPIPVPSDSSAQFNFVYVRDIAGALMHCVQADAAQNQTYNLSSSENVNYGTLMETLGRLKPEIQTEKIPLSEIYAQNIPLPFPLDQNELYDGQKAEKELSLAYTPFFDGMKESFEVFMASQK